jgi:xanthine/CO dehydrogenase XdhC/CoxF family maturation factor
MSFQSGYGKAGVSVPIPRVDWRENQNPLENESALSELHSILDTLRSLQGANRDAVLATVVHVTGSAYRRPGARMLLVPDGRRIGCVTGANLDAEVAKKAWWLTESRLPVVQPCGPASIILERTSTAEMSQMIDFLEAHRKSRKPAVIATTIRVAGLPGVRLGDRLFLDESWARSGALTGSGIETQVLTHASAALRERKSRLARLGQADVFVEWVGPPLSLMILGEGRDTTPLVRFARQLGWDVSISDGTASDPLSGIDADPYTAIVLMTHDYALDALLLRRVLPSRPGYLGLLGPRKRADKLFAEIGMRPGPNVHAPAGLDIGGDSPEVVALSIVAEIQASMSHRVGGMLKRRAGAIHPLVLEKGLPSEDTPSAAHALSHAR